MNRRQNIRDFEPKPRTKVWTLSFNTQVLSRIELVPEGILVAIADMGGKPLYERLFTHNELEIDPVCFLEAEQYALMDLQRRSEIDENLIGQNSPVDMTDWDDLNV